MSEVDTSAKAVKRWTVVRNNSGLGYSDGIAPDKYGGFVDYEAYRTLAAERDDLRAQLAEAQAQVQTARDDALREAAKLAWDMDAKYLRKQYVVDHNRKRYDISGVDRCEKKTANVISEDIHNAILALIDKDTTQ